MKHLHSILISTILLFIGTTLNAQSRNASFFGSYNRSFGFMTGKVSSDLHYPLYDEVKKLKTGAVNQLEVGTIFNSFGLAIIYNSFGVDASTAFTNSDVNGDAYNDDGVIKDNLKLKFIGLEFLYKKPMFNSRFDFCGRIALGLQSYSKIQEILIYSPYPSGNTMNFNGTNFTALLGMEIDYRVWKTISIGTEASLIHGNYKKLKIENSQYSSSDNVSRFNAGLKIIVTL